MFKYIKKLFGKPVEATKNEKEVWDVVSVVHTMLTIGVGDQHKKHEYILPLRAKDTEYKCSEDYFYLQLLSALKAFKGEMEWENYDDDQLVAYMISESFSDDKKARFLDLLGELSSSTQYTINHNDVFHACERADMIKMLLEFIYAARTFNNAWNGYLAFGYGASVIWSFLNKSSFKYMNDPLERAFDMICLLLGDDYDNPIPTSELKKKFGYPNISNKDLGELWYEERYS